MSKSHIPKTRSETDFTVRQTRDFNTPRLSTRRKPKMKSKKNNKGFGQ